MESTKAIPVRGGNVLGVDFESLEAITSQFVQVTSEVIVLHDNLAQVEDVATEITLVRACADVCKIAYFLRAKGDEIEVGALEKYDKLLQSSLERILGGPIGTAAVMQASLGVKEGGLGFRRAQDLALPAFIASRLEARWLFEK